MRRALVFAASVLALAALAGGLPSPVPSGGDGVVRSLRATGAVYSDLYYFLDGGLVSFGAGGGSDAGTDAGVPSIPLWNVSGPAWPIGYTVPINTTSFCASVDVVPSKDWALGGIGPNGLILIGSALGAANSLDVYESVVAKSGDTVVVDYYGPDAGKKSKQATASVWMNSKHRLSVCKAGSTLRIYSDGVDVTYQGDMTGLVDWTEVPANVRIGDLGAGSFVMPSSTASITSACISAGSGTSTGTTATDVLLGCSETTPLYGGPCLGCIATPSGPKVLAIGDSITQGVVGPLPRTYPARLQTLTRMPVTNAGVSGNYCFQVKSRWESTYADAGYSVVAPLCGINDFWTGAGTAATVWPVVRDFYDEVLDAGVHLVPMTSEPSDVLNAGMASDAGALNTLIANYATAHSLPLVDMYGAVLSDGGTTLWSGYYSSDHIHPNQIGSDVMAQYVCLAMVDAGWADGGCQ